MAEALLQYETIDVEQIDAIMAGRVPGPPKGWDDAGPKGGTGSVVTPIGGAAPQT